jgi:hypothetical protein
LGSEHPTLLHAVSGTLQPQSQLPSVRYAGLHVHPVPPLLDPTPPLELDADAPPVEPLATAEDDATDPDTAADEDELVAGPPVLAALDTVPLVAVDDDTTVDAAADEEVADPLADVDREMPGDSSSSLEPVVHPTNAVNTNVVTVQERMRITNLRKACHRTRGADAHYHSPGDFHLPALRA